MKRKLQILLVGGIGVFLVVFFLLPDPNTVDQKRAVTVSAVMLADVSKLTLETPDESITLHYTGGEWKLGDEGYAVDATKVKTFTELALAEWKLEFITSATGADGQYGLTEDVRTLLNVYAADGKTLRSVKIGDIGNRYNARYMRLADDVRVFQNNAKLGFAFDVTATDLREKAMLKLDSSNVREVRVTRGATTISLKRQNKEETPLVEPADAAAGDDGDNAAETQPADAAIEQWVDAAGKVYQESAVNDMLNTLTALRARSFADERLLSAEQTNAQLSYELFTVIDDPSVATVYLFTKVEDDGYLAGVSTAAGLFYIPLDDGERLDVELSELQEKL